MTAGSTYLVVDGENVDATLGVSVLGRRPNPDERPRWERVRDFAAALWDQPVKGLFFLNATTGSMPMPFVQALLAMDYRPVPLAGEPGQKVVDIGVQRMLEAIGESGGDVLLVSHDGDFLPQVESLLDGDARVAMVGFREFLNSGFTSLADRGLAFYDLEDHVGAFTRALPRVRVIPLDEFDPTRYL